MTESFAFLGTGSMGGAILDGLRATSPHLSVRATTQSTVVRRAGVESRAISTDAGANRWAVTGASVVVVGVKPFAVLDVLTNLGDALDPSALVISVAAGLTTDTIERVIPNPVIRAMPNTPALVGKGVTGISPGARATPADLERARTLFDAVGWVVDVPENQIDALSTISGSGPAYVFHTIEQWETAATRLGFSASIARSLVEKTFDGALALLSQSDATPSELRRRVTSPNGTTERAIAVLDSAHLDEVFTAAAEAALSRAREIADDLGR